MKYIEKCPKCGSCNLSTVKIDGSPTVYCHDCMTYFQGDIMFESETTSKETLTRDALSAMLQANFNLDYKTARQMLNFTINVIKAALNSGSQVHLRGFGSFNKKTRLPMNVTNFRTKERIHLDSAPTIKFKPSRSWLKEIDNRN